MLVSVFNNKGGVGKTTYMYHVAHMIARKGKTVLMVDCDSQCNLTAYTLADDGIETAWAPGGNSIFNAVELVYKGIGDIRSPAATQPKPKSYPGLYLVPGDLRLSDYEDVLGDTWNSAKGGSEPALRRQSALFRYIRAVAEKIGADITFIDLGPNLGALNRSVLTSSDHFIIPVSPDLFSIRGTENLGNKLELWRKEWDQCNSAWTGMDIKLPAGRPSFLGYVTQHHNIRSNATGMTDGWKIFGERLEGAIQANIVDKLLPLGQATRWHDGNYNLGRIPNLHSLVPYSLEARKPIFDCTSKDGLKGAHIEKARDSYAHFAPIADTLIGLIP